MLNEKGQGRWKRVGLISVVVFAVLIGLLLIFDLNSPIYNQPDLSFLLHFLFILGVSIVLTIVSARAYLLSGSINILLLGLAALIFGVLLMVAQWAVTPSLGSKLTPNEAVTIANMGILLASAPLFLSAVLLWTVRGSIWPTTSRKVVLGISYLLAFSLIVAVMVLSLSDLFPVFFISGTGSTVAREAVLALSAVFLVASGLLFGWKYLKTKSLILYWYSLGIVMFILGLVGTIYTVTIGDALNWGARIGFYLMGVYFLAAVLSRDTRQEKESSLAERWADAFSSDRQQIATFFSNMLNGFAYCRIITDHNGRPIDYVYLDVNPAFERNHGLKKEDIVGRRATEVLSGIEKDPTDLIGRYGRIALSGEPSDFEAYSPTEKKWFHYSVYSPNKGYFILTSEDITERKKAEQAIEEERARLQTILETAPVGIAMAEMPSGRFLYANEELWKIYRQPPTVPSSKEDYVQFRLFHPDGRPYVPDEYPIPRVARGEIVRNDVASIIRGDGTRGYITTNAAAIRNSEGDIVAVVGMSTDVTEQMESENDLKRSNAELQQFAYVASHDLQEPLRMVTAYLGLLETKYSDKLDGKAKQYMEFAIEGGQRAKSLISDLLEFSRVDSQAEPFQTTDMEDVLKQALSGLKIQIQDEHATITHDTLPTVFADESQMVQVLQNLISNAIKFHGKEPPEVHISYMDDDDKWLFSIQDNGIGIDPQYKDTVFVLFQRLHSRDEYAGTGIGLAISKKIVERHSGKIWFDSQVGRGATFYFTIPKGSTR